MKIKTYVEVVEESQEAMKETMRHALVETLLRTCDGRLRECGKSELSQSEQEWVQDVIGLVARSAKMQRPGRVVDAWLKCRVREPGRSPIARALSRVQSKAPADVRSGGEFAYVPLACGCKGDYFCSKSELESGSPSLGKPESEDKI